MTQIHRFERKLNEKRFRKYILNLNWIILLDALKTKPSKHASERANDFEIRDGFNWIFISGTEQWMMNTEMSAYHRSTSMSIDVKIFCKSRSGRTGSNMYACLIWRRTQLPDRKQQNSHWNFMNFTLLFTCPVDSTDIQLIQSTNETHRLGSSMSVCVCAVCALVSARNTNYMWSFKLKTNGPACCQTIEWFSTENVRR